MTRFGASGLPAQLVGLHAATGDPLGDLSSPSPPLLAFFIAAGLAAAVGATVLGLAVTTSVLVMAVTGIVHLAAIAVRVALVLLRVVAIASGVAAMAATVVAIAVVVVPVGLSLAVAMSLGVRMSTDRRHPRDDVDSQSRGWVPASAGERRPIRAPIGASGTAEVGTVADAA